MRRFLLALVAVFAISDLSAECKFDKMLKVVVRNVTPGVSRDSFAGQPKTIYRLGVRYGRTEEALDTEKSIHGLIIANEPDSWMINLITKTGQHLIDRGAPFHFHQPILWSAEEMPQSLKDFEFGCELAFMKTNGSARPERTEVQGEKVLRYGMDAGGRLVTLYVGIKDEKPRAVIVVKGGEVVYGLRYDSWEDGLAPDLNLFQPPEGIKFEDAK